jgi:hypothetical protein
MFLTLAMCSCFRIPESASSFSYIHVLSRGTSTQIIIQVHCFQNEDSYYVITRLFGSLWLALINLQQSTVLIG